MDWASAIVMGITMGIIMANVPQLVPVEKEIRQEIINTTTGSSYSRNPPLTTSSDRNKERPRPPFSGVLFIKDPIDHAMASIMSAGTMDLIPSIIADATVFIVISLREI